MPLLYDAATPAPNPRRVRMFLAEKGIVVPTKTLSIAAGEHKAPDFLALYPPGQLPVLALDDGRMIGESLSICRYFEALHPELPLFGNNPISIAEIDMWIRRIEMTLMIAIGQVWMHTHPFTARVVTPQYRDFGESNRPKAVAAMRRFDAHLSEQPFVAGAAFSVADIVLLTTIDFATFIGLPVPDDTPALSAWHRRISARPSAAA
ncbi:MAG: glutathione S-transferase family protein [Sphingomonadaceae bacterium]